MKLKEWRNIKGMSQEEFASLMNQHSKKRKYNQENICQWENGVTPRKPELLLIAKVTKKKVTALDFL